MAAVGGSQGWLAHRVDEICEEITLLGAGTEDGNHRVALKSARGPVLRRDWRDGPSPLLCLSSRRINLRIFSLSEDIRGGRGRGRGRLALSRLLFAGAFVDGLEGGTFIDEFCCFETRAFSIGPLTTETVRLCLVAFDAPLDADAAAFASWCFDHFRRLLPPSDWQHVIEEGTRCDRFSIPFL